MDDRAIVERQLGREPRAFLRVAVRCPFGAPAVTVQAPYDSGGDPFPTTFDLTCRHLVTGVARVEAAGGIERWSRLASHDEGLAKSLAPRIEAGVQALDVPHAVVGIVIALLVLLPETVAAVRAALSNRMQTSFNLALGSALATIGLTIPVVGAVSLILAMPLALGLPAMETGLLILTLFITGLTLAQSRATVLQGAVHLVLLAVFLFLAVVP